MKELTKEEITSLADALQHGVLAVQRKQAAQMLGVNGAANILRKSKQNFDFKELCKGLLASPLRIRLD